MRYSILISSLIVTLTAFGVNVTPHADTQVMHGIRRFGLTGTPTQNGQLTEAAAYARSLTRRRPTRRS